MISRRDFLQVGMATSAILGASGYGNWARLAAQQSLTQDQLLEFDTTGNVHADPHHGYSCAAQAGLVPRAGDQYRRGGGGRTATACNRCGLSPDVRDRGRFGVPLRADLQ